MIYEYIIPVKGVSKKVIYHFGDSHLAEYDELSTPDEERYAKERSLKWDETKKWFAQPNGEPFGDYERRSASEHFSNLLRIAEEDGDALVLTGDILDYVSGANLRFAGNALKSFKKPFIAVCGNHEDPKEIPQDSILCGMKEPVRTLDLGDVIIAAFDDSRRAITEYQNSRLKELLAVGKPIIIAMHVPIMTPGNAEKLRQSGEYFFLNYDECPKENLEFIKTITENPKHIAAVLAGHLHYVNTSRISDSITQYVVSQGIAGNINRYVIGE